jgi:hypothetical protein
MRKMLAALALLFAVTSAQASGSLECTLASNEVFRPSQFFTAEDSSDVSIRAALDEVLDMANIDRQKAALCKFRPDSLPNFATVRLPAGKYAFIVPEELASSIPHEYLKAILAHEVGHASLWEAGEEQRMSFLEHEKRIDALAARWVGRAQLAEALRFLSRLVSSGASPQLMKDFEERYEELTRSP